MKKQKHIAFICFVVVLAAVLIYVFFPQSYIKFLTQDVEKLEKATIVVIDTIHEEPIYVYETEEKSELDALYAMLKNTENTEIDRNPRHSPQESVMGQYEIRLFYQNGKTDWFSTSEDPQYVYRFFENENHGYIQGKNGELLAYVMNLQNNDE